LITCITTGKKPSELKKILERDFGVAYNRADTLVRTEMAHIQTQAAKQRYEDYGLRYYEFLGNDDDTCGNHSPDCHELDGERFLFSEMKIGVNAPPIHPNCKCAIIPVVEE
jgi:SPP1 gp7 family putative phage head morphogenesis protein